MALHPLATDDPGTLGTAAAEVELSAVGHGAATHGEHHLEPGLSLHVGVLDALDLGVGFVFAITRAESGWVSGMDNPVLDAKWRLYDGQGAAPSLAARVDYGPAHNETGELEHDTSMLLLAAWELSAGDAVSFNLGTTAHAGAAGTQWGWMACLGGVLALPSLNLVGEAFVDGVSADAWQVTSLVGATWGDSVVLSVGGGPTYTPDEGAGWLASLGLTVAFGPASAPTHSALASLR